MYIFSRSLVETLKMFCLSVGCSAIFSMMIFQADVAPIAFVCFILNLVSLLLFLIILFKNWQRVYQIAFTTSEYWVPATISFSIYLTVSSLCYAIASTPEWFSFIADDVEAIYNFRIFYRYIFQHSRFLEPMLNTEYAFLSFVLSQLLTLTVICIIPGYVRRKS